MGALYSSFRETVNIPSPLSSSVQGISVPHTSSITVARKPPCAMPDCPQTPGLMCTIRWPS
ncbi:hypothetical protein BJX65DRAFT_271861 [Aspergillus insuetus]